MSQDGGEAGAEAGGEGLARGPGNERDGAGDRTGPDGPRARALSRLKVLAGTTATGVVMACGYAVVDPLPSPMCFSEPQPGASGKFVDAPPGQQAEGVRFIQITITFTQSDGSAFSNPTAQEATSGASLDVSSQASRTGAYDFLVRVPDRVKSFTAQVSTSCPEVAGGGRVTLRVDIGKNDVVNVQLGF